MYANSVQTISDPFAPRCQCNHRSQLLPATISLLIKITYALTPQQMVKMMAKNELINVRCEREKMFTAVFFLQFENFPIAHYGVKRRRTAKMTTNGNERKYTLFHVSFILSDRIEFDAITCTPKVTTIVAVAGCDGEANHESGSVNAACSITS